MLLCLCLCTVVSSNNDDSSVHLSSTCDHVLDVVSVARAVDVCIVSVVRLILDVSGVDGDSSGLLLWSVVDLVVAQKLVTELSCAIHCNCGCKSCFTVVNVTDGTNVYVWLGSLKLFFSHHVLLVTFCHKSKK